MSCIFKSKMIFRTFSFLEVIDLVLIVSMIWIAGIQEIKLRIAQFILPNTSFELRSISCDKTSSFVNDVYVRQENTSITLL